MSNLVRSTQRVVAAAPAEVFELLASPARHAEIDGSDSVRGAVGGPQRLSLGAEFGMQMSMGLGYRTSNRVVEFEPDRLIAWQTGSWRGDQLLFGGQVWRYQLSPLADNRTLVRESYDLTEARGKRVISRVLGQRTEQNMRQTLERLAARFER